MITKLNPEGLRVRMLDVCNELLQQSEFKHLRESVVHFNEDHDAVHQFEAFTQHKERILHKQEQGLPLDQKEVRDLENSEATLYGNEIIRKFLYAQQEFNKAHDLISRIFIKTIELNRIPEPDEIDYDGSCGCGGSCGCK